MKNIFFLCVCSMIFFTACPPKTMDKVVKSGDTPTPMEYRQQAPEPGPAPEIQLGTYEQFELENGLKVIVVENHKLPRVSFSLTLDPDPFAEKEFAGTSDLAGQLMSRGTSTKTKAQIDEEVDFMGATLNTNGFGMYGASLRKHTDNLMDVMVDVLLNPSFPEDEFEKIKKQTLSGLATNKDDANAIAGNVASSLRYGKSHPYGEVITEETVGNITLEKTKQYYYDYFRPNIAYLTVVGDITPDEVKAMVKGTFGKWKRASVPTAEYEKPTAPEKSGIAFVNKAGAVQSVLNVTYPVELQPGSPDAIKARVMNTLLGGFFRSRLNGNLREDKGYTYGIRSSLSADDEIGSFSTSAGVRNEVTDSSIVQIIYEMNRLKTEPVPTDELDLVKNYLAGSFARSLESPQTVARFALNTIRYNLPSDYYTNYLKNLSSVTSADVMAMANKYIKPENAHIVVVGSKSEVAEKLKDIADVTYYDIYGNEINETFEIPEGTTAETVVDDYLNAIGGKAQLSMVKDVTFKMSTSMMGQSMNVDLYVMDGKFANVASMAGMGVLSRQVYNDGEALIQSQGQTIPVDDATKAQLAEGAVLFTEMKYKELGYKLNLSGVENLDGTNAYVVEVESPSGAKSTHYYSVETSLKVREVSSAQGTTITSDLSDYKEVEGIMFPFKNSISGMAPIPLEMVMDAVEVNKGIDPAVFENQLND